MHLQTTYDRGKKGWGSRDIDNDEEDYGDDDGGNLEILCPLTALAPSRSVSPFFTRDRDDRVAFRKVGRF